MTLVTAIDLAPYRLGTARDRDDVAAAVDAANRGTGFLAVTGHGVPDELCAAIRSATGAFFALPTEVKLRYVVADKAANRGYIALGSEALGYSFGQETPPDLNEGFNIGWEPPPEPDPVFFAPNVWPAEVPGFRDAWLAYWHALDGLGKLLMEVFAVALGLDPAHFEAALERNISVLRANHYERRAGAPEPVAGQLRLGPHSDYGSCTILLADPVPGLQLLVDDGWHDVLPPADGFLVNIGDLLAEWTNDRWHSTVHRVTVSSERRASIAFFQQPNRDAVIAALPGCLAEGEVERYSPTTSGAHLLAKLLPGKTLEVSAAAAEHTRAVPA